MKMFRFVFASLFSLAVVSTARAEIATVLGARSNTISTDLAGASTNSRLGYIAGVLGWLPVRNAFGIRSGFLYNQRFAGLGPTLQGDIDINYSYFDIPLTATYQFSTTTWAFAGPVLAFNQSRDVACTKNSGCSASDVKSFLLPWQIGADFKLTPYIGAEFFYEFLAGNLSANVSDMRAVGASLLIYID